MNNQVSTDTPASTLMSEEQVVECMKKSKSLKEWKIREGHIKFKLGDNFNQVWTKVILVSGVADEMFAKFEITGSIDVVNPWEGISISDNSKRIAPL